MNSKSSKRDLVTSLVLLVVTLIYYSQTFKIRQTKLISITSTLIPRVCVFFMVILSVVLALRSIRQLREARKSGEDSSTDNGEGKKEFLAAFVAFIVLFVGIFLIDNIGFVWGAFIYLMGSFITLGFYEDKKNWPLRVILSVVAPVLIYLAFYRGFHLGLPQGFLGLFGGLL